MINQITLNEYIYIFTNQTSDIWKTEKNITKKIKHVYDFQNELLRIALAYGFIR